jgi:hypothetical protein
MTKVRRRSREWRAGGLADQFCSIGGCGEKRHYFGLCRSQSLCKKMTKPAGGLGDAKSVTASLQRSRNALYKALHGSEMAVSQLSVDGELISDALNEHQYELKSSLKMTQSRLRTVQSYEFWERYSLSGQFSNYTINLLISVGSLADLLFSCCGLHSCEEIEALCSLVCLGQILPLRGETFAFGRADC